MAFAMTDIIKIASSSGLTFPPASLLFFLESKWYVHTAINIFDLEQFSHYHADHVLAWYDLSALLTFDIDHRTNCYRAVVVLALLAHHVIHYIYLSS